MVGENLREWRNRQGLTAEQVARTAREWGLDWTRVTVTAIERGKRSLDLREMIGLFHLDLAPADLFAGKEWVAYGPQGMVKASAVAALLSGRADEVRPLFDYRAPAELEANLAAHERMRVAAIDAERWWPGSSPGDQDRAWSAAKGEPEVKAAKALGLHPVELSLMAHHLFGGRSLSEERERRLAEQVEGDATPGPLRGHRGWVTKQLIAELRGVLERVEAGEYQRPPTPEEALAQLEALKQIPAVTEAVESVGKALESEQKKATAARRATAKKTTRRSRRTG